jgi:flagellum-specific peptidoglycan hydrolase FlgJ
MFMERKEFINSIKEGAVKGGKDYGIIPSLTIAQAILESGWGTSQLSKRAKNLFGIKAFSDWTGHRIALHTSEWYKGQMKIVAADFRAYDSFNESIKDHNKLLSYSRYRPVRESTDYKEACQRTYECGYATDPRYAEKLTSIIESYRLFDFDGGFESREATVEFLQELVNAEPVDGNFGPITRQAVMEYQRNKNIAVDGIVGEETWRILITT